MQQPAVVRRPSTVGQLIKETLKFRFPNKFKFVNFLTYFE